MRKMATLNGDSKYCRVMLHDPQTNSGVYVYLYTSPMNVPCDADHWHPDFDSAEESLAEVFGNLDWQEIPDPEPGSAHDLL